jgi:peptidoglycan/LPS O-acetylase OafA/YrhL
MRRTDLDALRIVLCAAVILLHAFMIFSALWPSFCASPPW